MIIRRRALVLYCLVILFSCSAITASAQNSSTPKTIIPLEGLDPVMLTQGKEVQGDMKYKVTREQFEYIFANAENKATFEKDPARYEIQLDGHCARMGAPTTGNPDLYAVHSPRWVDQSWTRSSVFRRKTFEITRSRACCYSYSPIPRGRKQLDQH